MRYTFLRRSCLPYTKSASRSTSAPIEGQRVERDTEPVKTVFNRHITASCIKLKYWSYFYCVVIWTHSGLNSVFYFVNVVKTGWQSKLVHCLKLCTDNRLFWQIVSGFKSPNVSLNNDSVFHYQPLNLFLFYCLHKFIWIHCHLIYYITLLPKSQRHD